MAQAPDTSTQGPALALIILGAVIAGAIIGAVLLAQVMQGPEPVEIAEAPLPMTGMQTLQNHRCMKAERKQIFIRGEEDNYADTGDEPVLITEVRDYISARTGVRGGVTVDRIYDEGGMDRFLLDQLDVPSQITNGLLVVKMRSLTRTTNDSINVGDMMTWREAVHNSGAGIATIADSGAWTVQNDIYAVRLRDLRFTDRPGEDGSLMRRDYDHVLDYIQSAPTERRQVDVFIGDDHIVDFIGLAVCQPPPEPMGLTLLVAPYANVNDLVKMSCATDDGVSVCNPHAGDMQCSASLPVACISPDAASVPETIPAVYAYQWVGGNMKFSTPVRGDSFATQDDVHAYCRETFGGAYRTATFHERVGGYNYVVRGEASVSRAWVHTMTEPYGNCWQLVSDYPGGQP